LVLRRYHDFFISLFEMDFIILFREEDGKGTIRL